MKIKRYIAPSMRAALALVREEQGPDAVILSSRRVEEGMEVIAAVDYDRDLFLQASRPQAPAPAAPATGVGLAAPASAVALAAAAPSPAPSEQAAPAPSEQAAPAAAVARSAMPAPAAAPVPAAAPLRAAAPASPAPAARPREPVGVALVHRELKDLRMLVESELAHLSWHDQRVREPLKARVLEALSAIDLAPDVALTLAAAAPRSTRLEDPSHIPLALLVRHLPVVERLSTVNDGIIAVVGPTGAGKTTTIAKLAARWCMHHGSASLALVTTDGYRVGAREQLRTYARILGTPLHTAEGSGDLERLLERLRGKRLVLIDTAGMAPRDVRLSEQLAQLVLGAVRARVLLALPAQGEVHALEEIVRGFARVAPAACVLTKVDEAASLGAALSVILRHRLRIAYVSDGQRVPEDLHAAHRRRIWLARTALKLKERAPPRGEAYLARVFGRGYAHA